MEYLKLEELDLLVCSYGGVGTTFFIKFLKEHLKVNHVYGLDNLKHLPSPPKISKKNFKVIYIFGDPYNSVLSFFGKKRMQGFKELHASKLLGKDISKKKIDEFSSLQDYLKSKKDLFKLGEHFSNWKNCRKGYPILFLRYETLWDNLSKVFDFLGLPRAKINEFPGMKIRSSDWTNLSEDLKEGLSKKYGSLRKEVYLCPDVWIRKNGRDKVDKFRDRKVVLMSSYHRDSSSERQEELDFCVKRNCENPLIDKVVLFLEEDLDVSKFGRKVKKVVVGRRMSYGDCVKLANSRFRGWISIIANTDIYFDETLEYAKHIDFRDLVLALARYDRLENGEITESKGYFLDGKYRVLNPGESQDAWMFEVPLDVKADFLVGVPGCEHRFNEAVRRSGKMLANPYKLVRAIHYHNTHKRNYSTKEMLEKQTVYSPVQPSYNLSFVY